MTRKAKRVKRRRAIRFDPGNWEYGDWPERLAKCVTVKTDRTGALLTVEFDFDVDKAFRREMKKIVAEVVEVFLDTGSDGSPLYLGVTERGMVISDEGLSGDYVIPWNRLMKRDNSDVLRKAFNEWLDGEMKYSPDEPEAAE